MESEEKWEEEAKRLIFEAVRIDCRPQMRLNILGRMKEHRESWADACDALEMIIVMRSSVGRYQNGERADTGFEIAVRAMLFAIADLRAQGQAP